MRARHGLALVVLSFGSVFAQDDAVDVAASMRRLKERDLPAYERDDLIDLLLTSGERGARPLSALARSELAAGTRQFDARREAHLRAFEAAAERLARQLVGPQERQRVEQLRAEALAHSRDPALTKEQVHDEIDPRVAELRTILSLSPDAVMASDEGLSESAAQLRRDARVVAVWADAAQRAAEILRDADKDAAVEGSPPSALDMAAALAAARAQAVALATTGSERDRKVLTRNQVIAGRLDPEEAAGLAALDELRLVLGLPVLAIDPKLCDAGRDHSADMERLGFFSHTSPVEGKTTPAERAARFGTAGSGENIAMGQATGQAAIRSWWYSPGHHRNMMGGYARVGLGRTGTYWTQMFGG